MQFKKKSFITKKMYTTFESYSILHWKWKNILYTLQILFIMN